MSGKHNSKASSLLTAASVLVLALGGADAAFAKSGGTQGQGSQGSGSQGSGSHGGGSQGGGSQGGGS